MGLAERVLDGEAGGPVDERERRLALRVLHLGAVPHVLVPVLHKHTARRPDPYMTTMMDISMTENYKRIIKQ